MGTGTSQGVPVIGCDCEVCQSSDPRDQRLRSAILLSTTTDSVAIDCGPDFRQQMLRAKVQKLDAILLTHEHNDHIIGLDDVRPFNFMNRSDMPVYATERVQQEVMKRFAYIFAASPYPGAPMVKLVGMNKNTPFRIGSLPVIPIEVQHGRMPVLGFRFGDFTYITDMKSIAQQEFQKLKGTKTLVINALHHSEHHSHLNLKEALEFIEQVQPEQAFLLHISHRMGLYREVQPKLPSNVQLAYDGLEVWGGMDGMME